MTLLLTFQHTQNTHRETHKHTHRDKDADTQRETDRDIQTQEGVTSNFGHKPEEESYIQDCYTNLIMSNWIIRH